MGRTFIRQATQIRSSDLYDDSIAPTLAAYETNPTQIEENLNHLRSQVQNILNRNGASFPTGDWFSDMTAPSTFEGGIKRGVDKLNLELHELERKRVLCRVTNLADVKVGSATGTLTATGNFADNDTVTTGSKVYTLQTTLTNVDGNVLIGATASDSLDNLIAAINLGAGSGTLYAAATTANGFVSAAAGPGDTMDVAALTAGAGGNAIATTETSANASWGGATLSGGSTANFAVLLPSQIPSDTTAAVGSVTTRGTVVAAHGGTFGTHSLSEVVGSNAIEPKNLCVIVDGSTRDPILSSNRTVYGLIQTESATDGHTITGAGSTRIQISFVRLTATGDDLEAVPAADISGFTINYASPRRKALEDLNEQDFLSGALIDAPAAGAGAVNRQNVYNNQGTTPVDLTTNATLDLEGAGIAWAIRDDLEANLLRVVEGSAGGTSAIEFGTDVDTFDNNAIVNDFATGLALATAGTEIRLAKTIIANTATIESVGAAVDLRLFGSRELFFDDANQAGSTWVQTNGIKLSEDAAEWDTYKTLFGGEVSLLNAVAQAKSSDRKAKVYANVTANVAANADVGGLAGGANLDAQLPDMSLGNFLTDYDVFVGGEIQRPGADAAANNDYYPGTSLANGQLRFEYPLTGVGANADVICIIPYK